MNIEKGIIYVELAVIVLLVAIIGILMGKPNQQLPANTTPTTVTTLP